MAFIQPPSLRTPFVTAGTGYLLQTSLNFLQQMWVAVTEQLAPIDSPTFTGTITGANASLSGNLAVAGTLGVTGATTLSATLTYGGVTLANAVSGTGKMVLDTSPILVTPNLGTPSTLILTNATGLPLTSGVTGDLPFANLAQGSARSVAGVAGNATADFASIQGSAGQILAVPNAGTSLAFTATPQLGASGTLGSLIFGNATSGLLTLQTVTGALGSVTLSLPAATDTLVGKATTDELTNKTLTTAVGKGTWTASGTWTLPAHTLGGTISGGGNQINNVIIGNSTPLAGSFTTLSATGIATISAADPQFNLNKSASGHDNFLAGQMGGNNRWIVDLGNSTSETGSNVGSDLIINRYSDAGSFQGTSFKITRSSGAIAFPEVGTTASAANAFLNSGASNDLLRSTSSLAYKRDVEPLEDKYADAVLQLEPIWYRSKAPADNPDWSWYGLGAEDVAKVDPRLVHWTYPEDAWEMVKVGERAVPVMEDVEEAFTEIVRDGDKVIARPATRKIRRQKIERLPVFDEVGEPLMMPQPTDDDPEAVAQMLYDFPVTTKEKITERRLKEGAQLMPDGVQYDRVAVLLLSMIKRMKSA